MASKWSELQQGLLESVLKRLTFKDIVQCKAVCSSWNIAMKYYISSPSYTQIPWLMLPHDPRNNPNMTHFCFFNLSENKFYNINNVFREFHNVWCIGSSHGFLMILDEKANPHLLNPFSNLKIKLPLINTLFKPGTLLHHYCSSPYFVEKFQKMYISKAVLLCDSFRRGESFQVVVVVVIFGLYPKRLAFCKPRENTWHQFGSFGKSYKDLIFCNGMLYALLYHSNVVEVWDFCNDFPEKVFDLELDRKISQCVTTYLVESMGEILFVFLIIGEDDDRTIGFTIYKLDCIGKRWVAMESLCDRALFISENGSVFVSTCELPEARGNLIYFTMGSKYFRVYSFKEKKIVDNKVIEDDYCRHAAPSFWIVPNPVN